MKGIILAGGSGTRLYPLTKTTSKQLLPVYDKPMIYYPLSTLMQFGIREILIISTPVDTPNIEKLFGNGATLGLNIQYAIQHEPKGIAQAFTIGADFIGDDDVCLILGDNIFHMGEQFNWFQAEVAKNAGTRATIFAYHVSDPERFGVVEFDQNWKALSIEEKPAKPRSNYAVTGLYFYPKGVSQMADAVTPSERGELEITTLNAFYLKQDRLDVQLLGRGFAWLDTGTMESLAAASEYIRIVQDCQGVEISAPEEIAFKNGWINKDELLAAADRYGKSPYGAHLRNVAQGKLSY